MLRFFQRVGAIHQTAVAALAVRTIKDHPEYYKYYSEKDFKFNNINQGNRNPLLYKELGADGLKTGHTEEAGYSLVASAVRGDRRVVLVLGGLPSMKARAQESERLIEWAFREYSNYKLVSAGDKMEDAEVWLGTEAKVPLTIDKDLVVTIPRKARKEMKVTVPPAWAQDSRLSWNGLALEKIEGPGCILLTMDKELLRAAKCQ